ncbi:MAG: FHA domain-containing protein [Bacteroidales bacterium]|nr:FHA domain-containing protein [Bacteroidales bacterium]MBR0539944.1 FHA domain-containing protein [Bacteroidales bacterium]
MKVVTIGRSQDNDVTIADQFASRHHLQIICHDDGHYSLSDFGSSNGTFVNGNRVSGEILLKPTDIVRIGNTTIPWMSYFEVQAQIPHTEINEDSEPLAVTPTDDATAASEASAERTTVFFSSTTTSVVVLALSSLPIIVIMCMGGWLFFVRLLIAVVLGGLAIFFSKRADAKVVENDGTKAMKFAKTALSLNVVQVIYGIFSWVGLVQIIIMTV